MGSGGLSDPELAQLRRALAAATWSPPPPQERLARDLSWFPSRPLRAWFEQGDGGAAPDGVRVFSLAEALEARRELLLRDLGPPLTSADRFLPLIRVAAGLMIFDGAANGVVLRRTAQTEAYGRSRSSPLTLAPSLEPRVATEAASSKPPPPPRAAALVPPSWERPLRLPWLSKTAAVPVHVFLERGQLAPTPRQSALVDELERHAGSLAAELEEALFLYSLSIRGLTRYEPEEAEAEAEPPVERPEGIWALVSAPEIWLDWDDGVAPSSVGFEVCWDAPFDEEHGVAVRVEGWHATGVGSYQACEPLSAVRAKAMARAPGLARQARGRRDGEG